jgi:membrane-associated phospholipid phosphatase
MRDSRALLPVALLGAGVITAAGFLVLARRVDRHETRRPDGAARKRLPKRRRRPTRAVAEWIEPLGKWYGQMPMAAVAATALWRARGPRAAIPVAGASAAAASLAWLLERVMPARTPPPGRHSPTEPAFPSGHALQTSAAAWAAAHVLIREGASAGVVVPLAVALPIASGLTKLYLDKHWLTDVLGGYLLGATIAASAAAGYELGPRPSRAARVRAWLTA